MSSTGAIPDKQKIQKTIEKGKKIVITGGLTIISQFGPESQILRCPYCDHFGATIVKPSAAVKTHLMAVLLCVCCCWLCSCCPYLINACMDRSHYCGHCNSYLGKYNA